MGLPKIKFLIATTGLSLAAANIEKIPGLVISGQTVAGKIAIGESRQFFSLTAAEAAGITEAENPFAYKQVKAFYNYAGTNAELWVMLVSDATSMESMADMGQQYAAKLLSDAGGRVRVLGIIKKSLGTEATANGLDADVDKAAIKAQQLADEFANKYFPVRVLISANTFTGKAQDLKDYKTTKYNRVALLLGNTDGSKEAAVGLALARLASIPVQRKLHRVIDGPVENLQAYFTNGEKTESLTSAWDAIADKNYIFFRNFAGKAGFFFSTDATLTSANDDFKTLSNGFVMDKAVILAYNILVEKLGDEVPMTEDGKIHPAIIKSWQNAVESNINSLMTMNGELSNCQVYIDESQDVTRTGEMVVEVRLQPVGYAEMITVKIGFTTKIV